MWKLVLIRKDSHHQYPHHQYPAEQPQYQTNNWFSHNINLIEIGRWVWPRGTYLQRRLKKFREELKSIERR